jgi:beta-galactosidase
MKKLLFLFIVLLSLCRLSAQGNSQTVRYDAYDNLVMAGYQGWFAAEGDESRRGWYHYGLRGENASVDFWPDMTEYTKKYASPLKMADGSAAFLYSAYDSETVDLHFKWMKEYGLDGVFMQRFVAEIKRPDGKRHFNKVLENALAAARKYGRAIGVMYDLSGCGPEDMKLLEDDWKELQALFALTDREKNPTYIWHNARPLLTVWGVGFNDNRRYSVADAAGAIARLKKDHGVSIMLGVPYYWRTLGRDTENNPALHELIRNSVDIVMPWAVGRYNNDTYASVAAGLPGDIAWCRDNSVDYVPLVFPGFSWGNLKRNTALYNQIPRLKGDFLWKQIAGAKAAGAGSLYVAMFDEIDEGTAIFKCAEEGALPLFGEKRFVGIERGLGSDHYLWLTGEAAKWFHGENNYSAVRPRRSVGAEAQVRYDGVFNPVGGVVDLSERPSRDAVSLNGSWLFMPVYETDIKKFARPESFSWDAAALKIPSPWNVNSFAQGDGGDFLTYPSYPKEWEKATMGWMRKEFTLPAGWDGKRTILHFEAIAGFAKIYVNGQLAGEGLDIFFATRYDITSLLKEGRNEIVVGVAKASLTDVPGPYGRRNYVAGSFWGQHIAGIWQDVWLLSVPELAISDVFVQPDVQNDRLNFSVTVKNRTAKSQTFTLGASIRKWEKPGPNDVANGPLSNGTLTREVMKIEHPRRITLRAGDSVVVDLGNKTGGALDYWTPETPRLYGAVVTLNTGSGRNLTVADAKYTRFGWRQFTIRGQELLLNGEPIVLKGDSWHFMGVPQMSRRYAWGWYRMLKEANGNAVRLHAQPYPSFYLDVADEMGICVLPETGIWSSDGGPKMDSDDYWVYCAKHVRDMVLRDRNHPSVFGWSVCNETLPVVINVFRAPKWVEDRQVAEINNWVGIVRDNDPTRDWISGDGEDMRPTDLPTVIGHYGDEGSMRKWSSEGKPWGVGETGMGYYGTPRQIAAVNGNRAYESQQGRMEGLAVEAYRLIKAQLDHKASYASVFNIAWYGLKPLEFGLRDVTRAPVPTDGVFFPEHREGVPGMQPERLGPYTSTINPGYDPALPLYSPWPMFDAIKAVYATPSEPYVIANTDREVTAPETAPVTGVGIVASEAGTLREQWLEFGVPFVEVTGNNLPSLIVVDGNDPPVDPASKLTVERCLAAGGTLLVWGVSPRSLDALNGLLPYPLELTRRSATSFLKKADDPIIGALDNKEYYFTELTRRPVMSWGLSGEIVRSGQTLLEAGNTDWSRWNSRAEYMKTAAVYRSEREAKPEGAALVKVPSGKGRIYLASLDMAQLKSEGENLLRTMLSNLGVRLKDVPLNTRRAFSADGALERALFLNAGALNGNEALSMENARFAATFESGEPVIVQTDMQGSLNLERSPGVGREDTTSGVSFWIFSPRSLVNLLVEPDMPKLNLIVGGQTGVGAWINGAKVEMTGQRINEMPLEQGWNHVMLRFEKGEQRGWRATVRLESNNDIFFNQLKTSVALP